MFTFCVLIPVFGFVCLSAKYKNKERNEDLRIINLIANSGIFFLFERNKELPYEIFNTLLMCSVRHMIYNFKSRFYAYTELVFCNFQ